MTAPVHLDFRITPQPNAETCGASCLHAIYRYYDDEVPLSVVIDQTDDVPGGGTLGVLLALTAMHRGYQCVIYTYNLQIFDPTWFRPGAPPLRERLVAQLAVKTEAKIRIATQAYIHYLDAGGEVDMVDLTAQFIADILTSGRPIIAGLSATWLYRSMREISDTNTPDDISGEPVGHFVVIHGYDPATDEIEIADPYLHEPISGRHHYRVHVERVIAAVLLGIYTYDAKLVVLSPPIDDDP